MIIGVPREIKADEYRVGLAPAGVRSLVLAGHAVLIEKGAGEGSGFTDDAYAAEGAEMADAAPALWRRADMVVMAIPDILIGKVAADVVPTLRSGAVVVCLDPAAPHGGELPPRDDISYFITHPCHPPLVNDETDPEARKDFFGGVRARQAIVCALLHGPETDYARGEALARKMFAPVMRAHRITVGQMALLEPAMAETMALTVMMALREGMDEVVSRGVPAEAARDFLLGHMGIFTGILFGFYDAQVSDGAKKAAARARDQIFQPDWKKIFERENVMKEIKAITQGR